MKETPLFLEDLAKMTYEEIRPILNQRGHRLTCRASTSCFGFEDQWSPERTTITYLKSDKFSFSCGGYDDNAAVNKKAVKDWIDANIMVIEPS